MSSSSISHYRAAGTRPRALARIALYLFIVTTPLSLAVVITTETDHPFVQEVSKGFALIAYTILLMQFVLAGRIAWVTRPFGLDVVLRFHRWMGILAAALLISHPVLYASADSWGMLVRIDQPWPITVGQVSLIVTLVLVVTSAARRALAIEFETWRKLHNVLAVALLGLGFLHSVTAGGDFGSWPLWVVWIVLAFIALASYIRHKLLLPLRRQRYAFKVIEVERSAADVHRVRMQPLHSRFGLDYAPGQFMLLTLHRAGLPVEEHPFTISSSPAQFDHIEATIKVSGDYTATIGETKPGDRASVSGPFGRFSYALHPHENELVFLAGGVGVTPMLSMLRHMQDTRADAKVVLLYASRTQHDIIASAELDEIARGDRPHLRVVHILSAPDASWHGERGRLNAELIGRYVPNVGSQVFYVSGPPGMIDSMCGALRSMGVPPWAIRTERFEL